MFDLYLLYCQDGYIYTGITSNLIKRLREHRLGSCKLTKNRGDIKLIYKECFRTRTEAAKREKEIKGWRRSKKEQLYQNKFTLNDRRK